MPLGPGFAKFAGPAFVQVNSQQLLQSQMMQSQMLQSQMMPSTMQPSLSPVPSQMTYPSQAAYGMQEGVPLV